MLKTGPMNEQNRISLPEQLKLQVEILKRVRDFCDEHGLRYYLSNGTLLGAIRHDGYIPWDDDIDIEMPRPDFNRLIELFHDQENLALVAPGDPASRYYYVKIYDTRTVKVEAGIVYHNDYLGVDIDVFPLDGSAPQAEEYEATRDRVFDLFNWYATIRCGITGSLIDRLRVIYFMLCHNERACLKEANALCEQVPFDESLFATRYDQYTKGYRMSRDCYRTAIQKDFEGELFSIPVGYDSVLRAQYGDYMQLPPVEKRITHHNNAVFWK